MVETPEIIEKAAPQPAFESLEAYEASRSNPKEDPPAAEIKTEPTSEKVETTEGSEKAEKPKRDRTAEGRIAELTRRAKELEDERNEWRSKAESATAPKPEAPKVETKPTATDGKPQLKQFVAELKADETYEDAQERWADAVADWREQQAQKKAVERETATKQQETAIKVKTKIEEARAKYQDFDQVTEGSWLTPAMQAFITDADSLDVIYHLGANREEVARISQLSHARQLAELGKIEARISQPEPKPTAPPVSKAPAPLRNVSGTAPESESDPTKAPTFEAYQRMRSKR